MTTRKFIAIILPFIAISLSGLGLAQLSHSHAAELSYPVTGKVSVVDADTFYIGSSGIKVRLHGFDAPGKYDKNQPDSVKTYADTATQALENLTRGGIHCGKQRGRSHDRTVHQCWIIATNEDLAAKMVWLGYGVDWPKFSKGDYADEEAAARAARRGIWATETHTWIK